MLGVPSGDLAARALPSARCLPPDATLLDEWEGKRLLAAAGVPLPEGRLCTAEEAPAAAQDLGFPVVVKLVHKDLAHKSDAGALKLGLGSAVAVVAAVAEIRDAVATFEQLDVGWRLTKMALSVRGEVPGITADSFQEAANEAKDGCPVSNALAGNVEISLTATLL